MWPWGHLAVGYLAYAGVLDRRFARAPGDAATVVLALATQLPDLIDKPFAWTLPLLPNGRSLGHSALVAALLIAAAVWIARRRGQDELGLAFGIGYATHLAGDALGPVLDGNWAALASLGWPLLPPLENSGPQSIVERFRILATELAAGDVSTMLALEFLLVAIAATLWVRHGYPGLGLRRDRTR